MREAVVTASAVATMPAVLVVGPLPPPWHGGSVATSYVLRAGLERRWRVLHLDTSDHRGLDNIGRLDVRNVLLALRHAFQLLATLMREQPQLVYVPIAQNTLGVLRDAVLILPSLALRRRIVLHVHGAGFRDFYVGAGSMMRALVVFMLRRANRIVVLSDSLRPMLRGLAVDTRVVALPNGIDDMFAVMPDRAGRAGPPRVLYLGNLMRSKGFLDVMEAVALLRARGSDVELDIAGAFASDADRAAAMPLVERLGSAVRLHGVVTGATKTTLLQDADIFAFPSYYANEGHPYVVLEAMAAGLPVITTQHAALSETVVHEQTGMFVPPRDPASLATTIARLIEDTGLRVELGAAARRRYESSYSLDVWADRLDGILQSALQ